MLYIRNVTFVMLYNVTFVTFVTFATTSQTTDYNKHFTTHLHEGREKARYFGRKQNND